MRILELNIAEFGKLKGTRIELGDGINVIGGDNESGKSTVMLFIRFMFYGLPKKSQKNNFRERSLSFDTHRAAGSMLIEHEGKQYRIERNVTGTTRPTEKLRILDLRSGELIPGEPWELFLGVGAEVFESSCAVHQSRAASIDKSGAARALENILASADESIDVSGILEDIDKVRREYKLNRGEGGLLYELSREIAELESKKQRATEKQLEINRLQAQLTKLENELESTNDEIKKAQKSLDIAKKVQILARFDALTQKRQEKEALEDELGQLDKSFPHKDIFPSEQTAADIENAAQSVRLARTKVEARKDEHSALVKKSKTDFPLANKGSEIKTDGGAQAITAKAHLDDRTSKLLLKAGIASACLAIACGAVAFKITPLISVAVLCAILTVIFIARSAKKRKEVKIICEKYAQSIEALGEYLEKCESDFSGLESTSHEITIAAAKLEAAEQDLISAQNTLASLIKNTSSYADANALLGACTKICADIRTLCAAKNSVSLKIAACDALISNHKTSLAEYDENTLRAELGSDVSLAVSIADAERALVFVTSKRESLIRNVGLTRETLAASRASVSQSPVELGDKISALRKKLDARSRYFDALMLAKTTIERASDSMSGNITPEISRKASEIMELISGGRHPSLYASKQLELTVDEDGFGFSADLLSEGARDAAYIALRISLMLRVFGDKLPPLMLDDAFCQLDDSRAEIMVKLIARLSELPLQSIIFTCHEREHKICSDNAIPHTYARLD